MIAAGLEAIGRHGTRYLAGGVLVGLVLPPVAHLLRPLLVPDLVLLLVLSLTRVEHGRVTAYARRPLLVGALTAWTLLASPLLVRLACHAFDVPASLATGAVLATASATVTGAVAFALLLGLDAAVAVAMLLASTAAVPFTLGPVALVLLGLDLDIRLGELTLRLGVLVGGAFLAAWLVRRRWPALLQPDMTRRLDGLNVIFLMLFSIAIMDGVTATLLARPRHVLLTVVLAFAANIGLQLLGALLFGALGRSVAGAVALCSGNRNMAVVLAVLADRAPADTLLFFATAQFPMYLLPWLLSPLYRRMAVPASGRLP